MAGRISDRTEASSTAVCSTNQNQNIRLCDQSDARILNLNDHSGAVLASETRNVMRRQCSGEGNGIRASAVVATPAYTVITRSQ